MNAIDIITLTCMGFGLMIYAYMFRKFKYILVAKWDAIARFIAFMVFVVAGRFAMMEIIPPTPLDGGGSFAGLPFVFWEDAFFAIPIWFVKDHLKMSKGYWISLAIALSLLFGSLHLYQGYIWAIAASFYPYYASYKYSKEYGFGTVMFCHIIYDFMTLLSVKLFLAIM